MGDPKYPSDTADKYVVRLPDGLRDRVRASAAKNRRTMNAEIVAAIEAACPASERQEIVDLAHFLSWCALLPQSIGVDTADAQRLNRASEFLREFAAR